jgi:hypothetical protein
MLIGDVVISTMVDAPPDPALVFGTTSLNALAVTILWADGYAMLSVYFMAAVSVLQDIVYNLTNLLNLSSIT